MSEISRAVGLEAVFLYTPTALVISLGLSAGEQTFLRRVESGAVDVDKLIRFDETLEHVVDGRLDLETALTRLHAIAAAPPPFPNWVTSLTCAICCGAVATLFRGSIVEIISAASVGLIVASLEYLHASMKWEQGWLEPMSGFVAAILSLCIAQFVCPIDDRLVTLAGLIVLLPGLRLTVALTELAVGHLSSGVARLAGAGVTLLTIFIGVALGWRTAGNWRSLPVETYLPAPPWAFWVAMLISPLAFAIVFRARPAQWLTIFLVCSSGFLASTLLGERAGMEVGAFSGALIVGLGSNLYARLRNRPALVALTPSIIILVPGSLGYRSLSALLDHETTAGIDFAFSMAMVGISLVGGILTANVILPPKRIL